MTNTYDKDVVIPSEIKYQSFRNDKFIQEQKEMGKAICQIPHYHYLIS
jgi:hypothetical protein